jgi:hypothetical protein
MCYIANGCTSGLHTPKLLGEPSNASTMGSPFSLEFWGGGAPYHDGPHIAPTPVSQKILLLGNFVALETRRFCR